MQWIASQWLAKPKTKPSIKKPRCSLYILLKLSINLLAFGLHPKSYSIVQVVYFKISLLAFPKGKYLDMSFVGLVKDMKW